MGGDFGPETIIDAVSKASKIFPGVRFRLLVIKN